MKKSKFLKQIQPKGNPPRRLPPIASFPPSIPIDHHFIPEESAELIDKAMLPHFIVVGAHRKQLIIVVNLQIKVVGFIDQHAMHERIRYEYYLRKSKGLSVLDFVESGIQKGGKTHKIVLGDPVAGLKFIAEDTCWPKIVLQVIEMWGFSLARTAHGVYMTRFPKVMGKQPADEQLVQIGRQLLVLVAEQSNKIPRTLDHLIGESACKSAIKFGDQVSVDWCKVLLLNASICEFPWLCVHGRPTAYFRRLERPASGAWTLL